MDLIQALVKKGMLKQEQIASLKSEIKASSASQEEIILKKGIIPEDVLFELKSKKLKIPLKKIPLKISPEILEMIPEQTASFYKIICLGKDNNKLEIGTPYPEDFKIQEVLSFLARKNNFSYQVFLITLSDLDKFLKQYKTLKKEVAYALKELRDEKELRPEKEATIEDFGLDAKERGPLEKAPAIKIIGTILKYAIDGEVSDIHIEPGRKEVRVRFRVSGILYSSIFLPLKVHAMLVARIKIMAKLKIDETRIPQDGRFSLKVNNKNIDFRIATLPTILGEKVVIRILDPTKRPIDFKTLGFRGRNLEVLQKALVKPYGLILATGPTGCGKTTTLLSILNFLNKEKVNIVTLEDPVEYFIEGIYQSQIRPDIGYSFSSGLRQIVRQDPDIIMVGEIRDNETASLIIHAALTGHLTLSTLHTSNAVGVIPRLINMGVDPFLIHPSFNIAIAQRLVRCLCPDCKEKIKPSQKVMDMLLKEIDSLPNNYNIKISQPIYIYKAKGCEKCNFRGFQQQIGLFEILEITDSLAEIILKEPSEVKIKQEAKQQGMITMFQDGILKVIEGIIPIEEVLRVTKKED